MAVAVAQVTQRIVIQGVDNASDAVRKAQNSLKGLEAQSKKTGDAANKVDFRGIRETSGDVESTLKGLADFSGTAGKSVSRLGDAFGATEAIMRLIPGPAGLAATAVAGIGLAAVIAAREAEQAAARLRQAFGGQTLASVQALRGEFSLSAEASVELGRALEESGKSASDVHDGLQGVVARAQEVGDDGSEAVKKFASGLTEGVTESQKLTNRLRALGVVIGSLNLADFAPKFLRGDTQKATEDFTVKLKGLEEQLKKEKTALTDLEQHRTGEVAALLKRTDAITGLASALGLNKRADDLARAAAQADIAAKDEQRRKVSALTNEIENLGERQKDVADTLRQAAAEDTAAVAQEAAQEAADAQKAFEKEIAENRKKAGDKASVEVKKRRDEEARIAQQRVNFAIEQGQKTAATFEAEVEVLARASEARKAVEVSASTAVAEARKKESASISDVLRARGEFARAAAVEAAQDAADRAAEITRIEASIEARRKEAAAPGGGGAGALASLEIERLARLDSAKADFDARDRVRQEQAEQRAATAAAELRGQIAGAAQLVQGPAAALGGKLGEATAAAATGVQQVASSWKGLGQSAPSAITAAGAVAGAFVEGERAKAGVAAITEAAASIASFAIGDIPGGVGHAAAAVLYGSVAAGAGGSKAGAGGASAAASGGGGFAAPAVAGAGAGPSSSQGQAIVINFNAPLTTRQEIGKGVQLALRSLSTTGLPKAKGA